MPKGMFEFLLPDVLASLSTLGAAYPAGQVAGVEKASQLGARDMEQQLRALQMMNERMKLNAPKWSFHQGVAIPVSPQGTLGPFVPLPVQPKQFPPLKPIEQAEQKALDAMTTAQQVELGTKRLEGQQKANQSVGAVVASYIDKDVPFEKWHPKAQEWWAKQMAAAPHPIAMALNKAVTQGKQSLNAAELEIYNRTMRTGAQQQKNMDVNAKRYYLSRRAIGMDVSDPDIQKLTPAQAKQQLSLLKQDFLGGLLSGGGLPGSPQPSGQPKTAEDLFKMMEEEPESSSE